MRDLRIAMCQVVVLDGDRDGNFVRIENAIAEAKAAGAQIVCLPEAAILGWVNPAAHKRACPIPGEDSQRLCRLAERHGLFVCAGLAEKDGPALYDSAVLIDDRGRILLKHRKINLLSELMSPPYAPGRAVEAAATRFGRVGLLICADTHDERILARMAALGPELLLVPYGYAEAEGAWPGHGRELERVVRAAARGTRATVVGTNAVGLISHGPWRGRLYGGHSVAADRDGALLAVGADRDRDVKVIYLDHRGGRPNKTALPDVNNNRTAG